MALNVKPYPGAEAETCRKLSPTHMRVSPLFSGILWYLCGSPGKSPWAAHPEYGPIRALSVTSDGFLLSGSLFIGAVKDLANNLNGVAEAADLNFQERCWLQSQVDTRIDWQPWNRQHHFQIKRSPAIKLEKGGAK